MGHFKTSGEVFLMKKDEEKTKLFIVEDSIIVRQKLREMILEIERVKIVGEADNAADAIYFIGKLNPDAVILDIRLCGVSGIDVLECIKKGARPPKVIILTNYPYPQYRKRCMELGADYFFDKSTEFEKVPEVISEMARGSDCRNGAQNER